jgi:Beta-propeller repeat
MTRSTAAQHSATRPRARRLVGLLLALVSAGALARGRQTAPTAPPAPERPLRFEPNQGQLGQDVSFVARGPGYGLFLTRAGATLALGQPGDRLEVVTMRLAGAAPVEPAGERPLPGASSYLVGDRSRWRTGVPGYASVRYAGVRPGVDLVYYGTEQRDLEYDLVVAPGADPAALRMTFEGVERATVASDGAAVLALAGGGELRKAPPRAYQERSDGERIAVLARYEMASDGSLGFTVGAYDRRRPLVIDPELLFATYLGGRNSDGATAVARDGGGGIYVTGYTLSTDFPGASPLQAGNGGSYDVFVTKLFPGSPLTWSTYLGGSGEDRATGIAVDDAGNVYLSGYTFSTNFPTSAPFQAGLAGAPDAFVTKLNPSGSALVYSTFLGGAGTDAAYGIAVDSGGSAYVAGYTGSTNFPTAAPIQATLRGSTDSFVTKLNAAGSALVYSTFLGGNSDEVGNGIAVDQVGSAYVVGWTASTNFPTMLPIQASLSGPSDVFVARLDTAGSALSYSTYLGGTGTDVANAIAVDASFSAYVGGYTNSTNFPIATARQPTFAGTYDGFVTKLTPAGAALSYSTYLGGAFFDRVEAISVANGQASVVGVTQSLDFPTASPYQASHAGGLEDAFLTTLSADGSVLVYSTYLGGSDSETAHAVASAPLRTVVAGTTRSSNFPVSKPLQGANHGGPQDVFLVQIGTPAPLVPASSPLYRAALGGLLLALLLLTPPLRRRA